MSDQVVELDEAMEAAWQFVKPAIIEQSKEHGLAVVWAKAFRSGWDARSRATGISFDENMRLKAEIELLREELSGTYEELIDHLGDDLNDSRANRVRALRAALSPDTIPQHDHEDGR